MNIKRIISLTLSAFLFLTLISCKNDTVKESDTKTFANTVTQEITDTNVTNKSITEIITENNSTTVSATTLPSSSDPVMWTKAEIAEAYKYAAKKSDSSARCEQKISFSDISINNGEFENVLGFVTPIMSKLLANNSTEIDGITGGYENLTESDIKTAKAYAVGDKIAIEMVMKEQTDSARGNAKAGSVGHAISAVGDINTVAVQLNDLGLPIEISEKDTTIHYTNAVVKVLIDSNGKIVNGTWGYTVEIRLKNYKVGNSTVETTSVILDNSITLNGGFKK